MAYEQLDYKISHGLLRLPIASAGELDVRRVEVFEVERGEGWYKKVELSNAEIDFEIVALIHEDCVVQWAGA